MIDWNHAIADICTAAVLIAWFVAVCWRDKRGGKRE